VPAFGRLPGCPFSTLGFVGTHACGAVSRTLSKGQHEAVPPLWKRVPPEVWHQELAPSVFQLRGGERAFASRNHDRACGRPASLRTRERTSPALRRLILGEGPAGGVVGFMRTRR
jgi:hypothetical protein